MERPSSEKLNSLREGADWSTEEGRAKLVRDLDTVLGDSSKDRGENVPNLGDIFSPEEVNWILSEAVMETKSNVRIVDHLIRTGYKDTCASARRTTAIHRAVRHWPKCDARIGELSDLLNKLFEIYVRFDVNCSDEFDSTHFHVACEFDCGDAVEKFLEPPGQVDPNLLERKTGDSPLHLALRHRQLFFRQAKRSVESLLRHGANPNLADAEGETPLLIVARKRNENDLATMLFELGDPRYGPVRVDVRDASGNTPLHYALGTGYGWLDTAVTELLPRGADPSAVNARGETPLHALCKETYEDYESAMFLERFLLEFTEVEIDALDEEGNTALQYAVVRGCRNLVESFLRHGASPYGLIYSPPSSPPSCIATRIDKLPERLSNIRRGQCGPELILAWGRKRFPTLLQYAVYTFHACENQIHRLLVDKNGPVPNVNCRKKLTKRRRNFERFDEKLARIFFEANASRARPPAEIDARDLLGRTMLHLTVTDGFVRMTEFLLSQGADPNSKDAKGYTPLHFICQYYRNDGLMETFFEICKRVDRPVLVDARDNLGRTPLQWAVASLEPDALDLLLDKGADLSSFVFPTEAHFDECFRSYKSKRIEVKLRLASGMMTVVERLKKRGYELDRSDATLIVKFFARHGLFETTRSHLLTRRWYNDERIAAGLDTGRRLSLDLLIQLRADEAANRLAHNLDYNEFALKLYKGIPQTFGEATVLHLCEKLSARFFRRWALDPFMELTHYRLPHLCSDMVLENLKNEDLYRICLAASGQS